MVEPNKQWTPCHKRVPAVVIECMKRLILSPFLRRLRAGDVCRQVVDVIPFDTKSPASSQLIGRKSDRQSDAAERSTVSGTIFAHRPTSKAGELRANVSLVRRRNACCDLFFLAGDDWPEPICGSAESRCHRHQHRPRPAKGGSCTKRASSFRAQRSSLSIVTLRQSTTTYVV